MTRYTPIIPPSLDPRNEFVLAAEAKERVVQASNGLLTDISPGSPISALMEGHAFAQAELLYYLNQAPEAWTATFLAQVLGIQILSSQASSAVLEFTREQSVVNSSLLISSGFRVSTSDGIVFATQSPLEFAPGEITKYVIAQSTTEGASTNVAANTITTSIQSLTGIAGITNPSPAYGGVDGETYNDAKSRAFNQIRRRNPVSVADFEDLAEDILGTGTIVRVTPNSSAPLVQVQDGLFVEPSSDADLLFSALLEAKRITGQEQTITDQDVATVTATLDVKNRGIEHLFISVKSPDIESIDTSLLLKAQQLIQNRSPASLIVHVENALVQLVDVQVILQAENTSVASEVSSLLTVYFNNLGYGTNLDYSEITAVISRATNITDTFITTGAIVADEGLSTSSVVDNAIYQLSKTGITIFTRPSGSTGENFFEQGDVVVPYANSVLWKLNSVSVLPSTDFLNVLRYGTLLECRSDQSSVRADGNGGTYITENDLACTVGQPDLTF